MTGINIETQILNDKNLIHMPDGNIYRKQDNNVRSIFYAGGAAAGAYTGGIIANIKAYKNLKQFERSFSSYELEEFNKSFTKLLKDKGYSEKLLDVSKNQNIKVLWNDMYDWLKSKKYLSKLLSIDGTPQTKEHMEAVKTYLTESFAKARGIQAGSFEYKKLQDCIFEHVMRTQTTAKYTTGNVQTFLAKSPLYSPDTDKIILSKVKSSLSGFHEYGHMVNVKNPLLKANMRLSRFGNALSLLILGITMFKRPKAEGEEPQGAFDKATTFVQKNAVTLTALAQMPRLIDEANATITGYKYAKNYLNPSQLKNMLKLNGKAFLTYLTLAGGIVAAVGAAKAVKNWLCKPEKIE